MRSRARTETARVPPRHPAPFRRRPHALRVFRRRRGPTGLFLSRRRRRTSATGRRQVRCAGDELHSEVAGGSKAGGGVSDNLRPDGLRQRVLHGIPVIGPRGASDVRGDGREEHGAGGAVCGCRRVLRGQRTRVGAILGT
eukprot:321685_1